MSLKGLTIHTAPEAVAHVKAEDDRTIWEAIFGVDAVLDVGNKLKYTLISSTKLRILDGVLVTGGAIGRIPFGEYEDVTIENGTAGQHRNDLIVAEIQVHTSVEQMKITYVKGTPGVTAEDPSYVKGNVYEGATIRQFPLYRVKLNGVNIEGVDVLFEKVGNMKQLSEKAGSVDQMNQKVAELNHDLYSEVSTSITTGFFVNPIIVVKRGKAVHIRVNTKILWSFAAAAETKIANLPFEFVPKYDTRTTLFRGAVPIGYVEVRTDGIYLISSAASEPDSFWSFDTSYWLP